MVDGYFFVAHWGKTPRHVIREFTENHPEVTDKVLGVVLNKVDLKKLGRYGAYQGSPEYAKYAQKYFATSVPQTGPELRGLLSCSESVTIARRLFGDALAIIEFRDSTS